MTKTAKQTTYLLLLILVLIGVDLNGQDYSSEVSSKSELISYKESLASNNYNLVYNSVYWIVDPAVRHINGNVLTVFKAKQSSISEVVFDLNNSLTVDSIKSNQINLNFTHSNNALSVDLDKSVSAGALDSVRIYYHGIPTNSGTGAFTISNHNGTPVLWTLSEPYGAMEWWPCKQSLNDKIDSIDIFIETPKAFKAASNGVLVSETINNDKKITHWQHRHPIAAYLVAIAVTDYVAYSHWAKYNETDSVEILNYVYPENKTEREEQTEYTVEILELFSDLFIPYPYYNEKYGHAEFGWGGGMEHQTMSFMGSFGKGIIVHELAHQWFGNHVTCKSWEDIWINEGFAVFCEGLAVEKLTPNGWKAWMKSEFETVLNLGKSGSVHVDDTTDINRIFAYPLTYKKGGILVHMLRKTVGDDAFFAAVRKMLTNKETGGGYASANDFKKLLEHEADTNLTVFFENWYYGQGFPKYTIKVNAANTDSTTITISQSTTHSSVSFFPMNVPIAFINGNNSETRTFTNTINNQTFTLKPGLNFNSIEFDPNYSILAPHPAFILPLDTSKNSLDNQINISPNPANTILNIRTSFLINLQLIELFDITGKQVLSKKYTLPINFIELNIAHLNRGQYLVKLATDSGSTTKPIILK